MSDTLFFTEDIYNEKQDRVSAFKEQGQAEKNQVNKQDLTGGKRYGGRMGNHVHKNVGERFAMEKNNGDNTFVIQTPHIW